MLELKSITKSYALGPLTRDVLRQVDLKVGQGESVAIVGASGSGKSTLLKLVGLIDRPSGGRYSFEGTETTVLDDTALARFRRDHIGFIFQQLLLLPHLTAAENVALPLFYRGVPKAAMQAQAMQMLERLGLAALGEHLPAQMSGGEQQRIALARALVTNPRLILADEPTGALDPRTREQVTELLMQISSERKITIVVVTHDEALAGRCQRRVQLSAGVIHSA